MMPGSMAELLFDSILVLTLLAVALSILALRQAFAAVLAFVTYGLLLAIAWVRLGSVDVALTEAAIGAGVTGVLLIAAASRLRRSIPIADKASPGIPMRIAVGALCATISAALVAAVLHLPTPAPGQALAAVANLPSTGLGNPVTGVLLAYRAIDTLLEAVVLVLVLLGDWSMAPDGQWGGRPGPRLAPEVNGPLGLLVSVLPPVGILIGIHIFWIGADMPGGAFQGGTILGAMWILTWMAGRTAPPHTSSERLRLVLVVGPALFLVAGFAGIVFAEAFLAYPEGWAKPLIIGIEAALTVSIAAALAMLVAGWPSREAPR